MRLFQPTWLGPQWDDLRRIGANFCSVGQSIKIMFSVKFRTKWQMPWKNTTKLLSADSLMKDEVESRDGEHLGKILVLMIDMERGCIAYAVLSFGGLLGIGDKLFAAPWEAFRLQGHTLILNVDKDTLKRAPGFDKDYWPDIGDSAWAAPQRSGIGAWSREVLQ